MIGPETLHKIRLGVTIAHLIATHQKMSGNLQKMPGPGDCTFCGAHPGEDASGLQQEDGVGTICKDAVMCIARRDSREQKDGSLHSLLPVVKEGMSALDQLQRDAGIQLAAQQLTEGVMLALSNRQAGPVTTSSSSPSLPGHLLSDGGSARAHTLGHQRGHFQLARPDPALRTGTFGQLRHRFDLARPDDALIGRAPVPDLKPEPSAPSDTAPYGENEPGSGRARPAISVSPYPKKRRLRGPRKPPQRREPNAY